MIGIWIFIGYRRKEKTNVWSNIHVGGGRSDIMLKSFKKCSTSNTVHEIKDDILFDLNIGSNDEKGFFSKW